MKKYFYFLTANFFILSLHFSLRAETKKVYHPESANGLVRIEKDGAYIYKTAEAPSSRSSSVKVGFVSPPMISSFYTDKNNVEQEIRFEDMYGGQPLPILNYEYEWQIQSLPQLRYHAGVGLFFAEGRGRLIATNEESEEKFNFVGLPLNLGLTLRLSFSGRQIAVPYLTGGGSYFLTVEKRDDKNTPKFFGVWGGYAGAGLLINISKLDRETSFNMQNEYGITNLWLIAEFRYMKTASELLDFGEGYVTGGVAVDF